MPFAWSLNPYMGCVAPLHVLLREGIRTACRPAVRRGVWALDPRQGERRRSAAHGARPQVVAGRLDSHRRGDRPVPARRGTLRTHPPLPRGARRRIEPFPHRHPRAPDRARRRRARRGGLTRAGERQLLRPDPRRRRVAAHRAWNRAAPSEAARALGAPPGGQSMPASRSRLSCRASRTGPSSWRRSSGQRAPPVPTMSGRASSTCDRGRASTSSSISPRTGLSWHRSTSAFTESVPIPRAKSSSACASSSRWQGKSSASVAAARCARGSRPCSSSSYSAPIDSAATQPRTSAAARPLE